MTAVPLVRSAVRMQCSPSNLLIGDLVAVSPGMFIHSHGCAMVLSWCWGLCHGAGVCVMVPGLCRGAGVCVMVLGSVSWCWGLCHGAGAGVNKFTMKNYFFLYLNNPA